MSGINSTLILQNLVFDKIELLGLQKIMQKQQKKDYQKINLPFRAE